MIVADAGVVLEALLSSGEYGRLARHRLGSTEIHAPELIDLEVLSALRRLAVQGEVTLPDALRVLGGLSRMRIYRHSHANFVRRIWELSDSITPYDAAYVAIAERADATLLTLDRKLAAAHGPRCRIELFRD